MALTKLRDGADFAKYLRASPFIPFFSTKNAMLYLPEYPDQKMCNLIMFHFTNDIFKIQKPFDLMLFTVLLSCQKRRF